MARSLRGDLVERRAEWMRLGVPALMYTAQNFLLFVGAANLDASAQQLAYQTKILFTALFARTLLGTRLGSAQWLSMLLLVLGVLNIQLALFSALIALAALFASGELLGRRRRLLHGFTAMTWAVVLMQSAGGIVVAVTIKVSVILGALGSHVLFGLQLTSTYLLGIFLVLTAMAACLSAWGSLSRVCGRCTGCERSDEEAALLRRGKAPSPLEAPAAENGQERDKA
ncbi:hypothetical protein EMIHUDRAFT_200954 [Emiliania huxleyi CCMP1516]|uniref:Nucleotide-sugar transporter n=2 Tax=Emiliania huxleyi TaxID=2903 RepID=A0A0D3KLX0_EMIH1|nr:hypothetical protein EMIHUDRAFT_200954 [Emiliania huxleyi CCMP1516]EOD36755.1 hypothetical protein EMIHUDRAFT_200954 [Emiliania huxleyi CCMP1516]|eukprot:XP_005789184.1 hypothetical protein EMIHUDRAFT_200954 [Emiliania huxleyi CCMP1516]